MSYSNHGRPQFLKQKAAADAGTARAAGIATGKKPDKTHKESKASLHPGIRRDIFLLA